MAYRIAGSVSYRTWKKVAYILESAAHYVQGLFPKTCVVSIILHHMDQPLHAPTQYFSSCLSTMKGLNRNETSEELLL
jgi:hypothetical protein